MQGDPVYIMKYLKRGISSVSLKDFTRMLYFFNIKKLLYNVLFFFAKFPFSSLFSDFSAFPLSCLKIYERLFFFVKRPKNVV